MRSPSVRGYIWRYGNKHEGDASSAGASLGRSGRSGQLPRVGCRDEGGSRFRRWLAGEGCRFHHTVGIWPLHFRDQTSVLESVEPNSLVLQAKVRPFGFARIELELSPSAHGTRVAMTEEPSAPFLARISRRLFDPVIFVRNHEALRRLENLVRQVDVASMPS